MLIGHMSGFSHSYQAATLTRSLSELPLCLTSVDQPLRSVTFIHVSANLFRLPAFKTTIEVKKCFFRCIRQQCHLVGSALLPEQRQGRGQQSWDAVPAQLQWYLEKKNTTGSHRADVTLRSSTRCPFAVTPTEMQFILSYMQSCPGA